MAQVPHPKKKTPPGCLIAVGVVSVIVILPIVIAAAMSGDGKSTTHLLPRSSDVGSAVVPPAADTSLQTHPGAVIVQIGGGTTEGFSGSIGNGGSQRSVQGVSPSTFSVAEDGVVVAVIQSKGRLRADHPLTVSLLGCSDGHTHTQSTAADYGVVSVSC